MYENMTMRAVNQSIGRAIRHKDDYATVILLDKRFNQSRIKQKLPQWIQDAHIDSPEGFAGAMQLSRKVKNNLNWITTNI